MKKKKKEQTGANEKPRGTHEKKNWKFSEISPSFKNITKFSKYLNCMRFLQVFANISNLNIREYPRHEKH